MGGVVKTVGNAIGSVAKVAAPLASFIPGVGPIASAAIGGLGGLLAPGGNLQQAAMGAMGGYAGGQGVNAMQGMMGGGGQGGGGMSSGQMLAMLGLGAGGLAGIQAAGGFKPQIGTAGGGAATGVADNYSNYTGNFMNQGTTQAIQSMLNGRPGDPTSLSQYFNAGLGSNGEANIGQANAQFNPTGLTNTFDPQQVNSQINPMQVGGTFNSPQFQGPNSPNVLQGMGQMAQLGNVVNPAANVNAAQTLMQHQQANDIANLRERFGNQALGSGAQLAEADYRAQSGAQNAMALDNITRQNNAMALTQRGQDLSNFQGARGLDVQQLGLGSNQALGTSSMANNFNQNNAQFGAQNSLSAALANQSAMLQAAGLGQSGQIANNQFGAQAGQMNLQAGQLNNQFGLNAAQMNQGNQQFNINALMQNQGLGNQFNLGMQNVGNQQYGIQANSQQAALAQMMQALGQTQRLGTAQNEVTVAPSWGSQLLGGAAALGNMGMGAYNAMQAGQPSYGASGGSMPQAPNMGQFSGLNQQILNGMGNIPDPNSFNFGAPSPMMANPFGGMMPNFNSLMTNMPQLYMN